jgi:hypothetical protein
VEGAPSALAAWNGALVVGLAKAELGALIRIDPRSGEARRLPEADVAATELASDGERLLALAGNALVVLDPDGRRLGTFPLPASEGAPRSAPHGLAPLAGPAGASRWLVGDASSRAWWRVELADVGGELQATYFQLASGDSALARVERTAAGTRGPWLQSAVGSARSAVQCLRIDSDRGFEWLRVSADASAVTLHFGASLDAAGALDLDSYALALSSGGAWIPVRAASAALSHDARDVALSGCALTQGSLLRIDLGPRIAGSGGERAACNRAWLAVGRLPPRDETSSASPGDTLSEALPAELCRAGWTEPFERANAWTRDGEVWIGREGSPALVSDVSALDFELEFEWAVEPGGAGSVAYRDWAYAFTDEAGHADGLDPRRLSGAQLDFAPPAVRAARAVGAWNRARIVARGGSIEHWLNGVLVTEHGTPAARAGTRAPVSALARGGGVRLRRVRWLLLDT